VAVFVGKQAHGSDQSGSGGDPFIKEKGSFTLVSGILNDEPILAGVAASNRLGRVGSFLFGPAAIELPKGLRINVVSPHDAKRNPNLNLPSSLPA